jgi:hypothetical protein
MVGYVESAIPDKPLSDGVHVMVAIRLPQLIIKEVVIIDVGKIERPRLSLLLRNGRLVARLELDAGTHWDLNGPTLQSVLQTIPSGIQLIVLQITKQPSKMQIWLNGDLGSELDIPQGLSGTLSGACRLLASFEQDRPAADITVAGYSIGQPFDEAQVKALTRRTRELSNALEQRPR